jgi:hypothetical protein
MRHALHWLFPLSVFENAIKNMSTGLNRVQGAIVWNRGKRSDIGWFDSGFITF